MRRHKHARYAAILEDVDVMIHDPDPEGSAIIQAARLLTLTREALALLNEATAVVAAAIRVISDGQLCAIPDHLPAWMPNPEADTR